MMDAFITGDSGKPLWACRYVEQREVCAHHRYRVPLGSRQTDHKKEAALFSESWPHYEAHLENNEKS